MRRHSNPSRPLGLLAALALAIAAFLALAATPALAAPPAFSGETITEANSEPLAQPWGMAFDSSGNLFLADPENSAIDKFDSANSFTEAIGGLPEEYARSVAVNDTTGVVYVAESGLEEIWVYKPEGGGGYELIQEEELGYYEYLAVDNSAGPNAGHVYAIGGNGNEARNYATNGEGELTTHTNLTVPAGGFGLYGGVVSTPSEGAGGLAVDPSDGHVYIAGPGKNGVWLYNPSGGLEEKLEGGETPAGAGFQPIAVAVDPSSGDLYVAEQTKKEVYVFEEIGEYEFEYVGSLEEEGNTGAYEFSNLPLGVAVQGSGSHAGDVYVSEGTQVDVFAGTSVAKQPLTVTKTGTGSGTVTSSPPGIECGSECEAEFPEGETVELSATEAGGSEFAGWSGAGCSGTGTCTVTMSAAKAVSAEFVHVVVCTGAEPCLNVNAEEGEGTVASSPGGIVCGFECEAEFATNEAVVLTASPAPGYLFKSWKGCTSVEGRKCHVTMSESKTVGVKFTPAHAVTLQKAGSGLGSVSGVTCPYACTEATVAVADTKALKLKAKPYKTAEFTGWSGDVPAACEVGAPTECVLLAEAGDKTVEAEFAEKAREALTVAKTGHGEGLVKSKPAGISCSYTCSSASALLYEGESVELTEAVKSGKGSAFVEWTGGTGSAASCNGSSSEHCTFAIGADSSIEAKFE